jgi:glycosidase
MASAMADEPRARIQRSLTHIYGAQTAETILPRIDDLVKRRAGSLPAPTATGWTEGDALLITYPDQVRRPPEPPLHVLSDFIRAHLTGLVSGVHLLPFYPSSSDDGFSIVDYRQVDPALGSWDDIHALAHGFRLMFDAVINHVSAQSAWFRCFQRMEPPYSRFFITPPPETDLSAVVRPRTSPLLTTVSTANGARQVWTTFSADQVDLNYWEPQVLLEMLDLLLDYVRQGAGLLRLDAIAFLWKEPGTSCLHLPQTHDLIRIIRAVLDLAAPHVLLVTETNVPHAENVSYFGDGCHEAQMVYNFALPPLMLDAIERGSASALSTWASSLKTPGPATCFFNFLASHDGIGLNPVRGLISEAWVDSLAQRALAHGGHVSCKQHADGSQSAYELNINYFDALSNPEGDEPLDLQVDRFMAAHAAMLSLAGVPGIYFHSLFGSRGWPEGVGQTGRPRSINRQKLERTEAERELCRAGSLRSRVFQRFSRLLRVRRASPAFHPNAPQDVLHAEEPLFVVLRTPLHGEEPVLCLHNLTHRSVTASLPPIDGRASPDMWWKDAISDAEPVKLNQTLDLAPYEVRWLCPQQEI